MEQKHKPIYAKKHRRAVVVDKIARLWGLA